MNDTAGSSSGSYRIDAIDLLRGLVMIIMALDHTRDFIHKDAWTGDPLNLETTTPLLYFTRWITHYCAPVFVFLAGASAFLQGRRKSKGELGKFLITRGFWLIFIEITIVNFSFAFDPQYHIVGLQTIWSIGISMVLLGLLIHLPFEVILVLGLLIVCGHNLLDLYEKDHQENYSLWYMLVHKQSAYPLSKDHLLLILYPFVPWTGLMIMGYCSGKIFSMEDAAKRNALLLRIGLFVIIFFIGLRLLNFYGDPEQWSQQKNILYTVFSFLDVEKYPPSLLYMCMTIGPALIFIALQQNVRSALSRFIIVYGRVPFFYYILHFYLIHLVSAALYLSRGHSFEQGMSMSKGGMLAPNFIAPGEGYSLGIVYLVWICVVLSLYPLCKWFSDYKSANRDKKWLSYL